MIPAVVMVEGIQNDDMSDVIFTDMAIAVPRTGDIVYTPPTEERQQDFWKVNRVEWDFGRKQPEGVQRVCVWLDPVCLGKHEGTDDKNP